MSDNLQEQLDAAFPASADEQLVRAVQQGILLADGAIESEAWLRGPVGRDVRGHLRRAGILSRVHAACVAGDLPFTSAIEHMPRGPFHWVEISAGDYKAHICRTDRPGAFPEDTPTRQDERLSNQGELFDNVVPLREGIDSVRERFAWLTFGVSDASKLGHLCWAMPAADGKSWLAHSNVLFRLMVAQVQIKPEVPDERVKVKFRNEIADSLKKPDSSAAEEE